MMLMSLSEGNIKTGTSLLMNAVISKGNDQHTLQTQTIPLWTDRQTGVIAFIDVLSLQRIDIIIHTSNDN